jgi:hypothetical protein
MRSAGFHPRRQVLKNIRATKVCNALVTMLITPASLLRLIASGYIEGEPNSSATFGLASSGHYRRLGVLERANSQTSDRRNNSRRI